MYVRIKNGYKGCVENILIIFKFKNLNNKL